MIKKKLGKILFAWDPNAFKGKGYWYVAGKNDSYTRAATKLEASKLGIPKSNEMPPNGVDKTEPATKSYYTINKKGLPVRRYTRTGSKYEESDITRSKSLAHLATEKLLSGESLGKSISGAVTDKSKAVVTSAKKLVDPMYYLSKLPGVGQLAAAYYGKKTGASAEDIAYHTGVRGEKQLMEEDEDISQNFSEENKSESQKLHKEEHSELLETIKKSYRWGEKYKAEKVKKDEEKTSGILGTLAQVLPGVSKVLPLVSKVLPVIASAAVAYAGVRAIDWGAGKLGVGKDEKTGKDLQIDESKDSENWEKMNLWEKVQSGTSRGIEKVGDFVSPNISRQAKFERVKNESEWLKDREIDNANWDKMSLMEKIQSGTARGVEQVGGVIAPGLAKKAKASRIKNESSYMKQKEIDDDNWNKMNMWQKIESGAARGVEKIGGLLAPDTARKAKESRIMNESNFFNSQNTTNQGDIVSSTQGVLSGVTTEQITSHPNFQKYYKEELEYNPSDKNTAYQAASERVKTDLINEQKITNIGGNKGVALKSTKLVDENKLTQMATRVDNVGQTTPSQTKISKLQNQIQSKKSQINQLQKYEGVGSNIIGKPNDKALANIDPMSKDRSAVALSQPQPLASRMNDSVKENMSLTNELKTSAPVIVNSPTTNVVKNQVATGGGGAKTSPLRNDDSVLTRLQYQNYRPV